MARRGFNPDKDPNAIDDAPAELERKNACFASGCPMPGVISLGGRSWNCGWHHLAVPSDIPRITQVLKDWECLTYEINVGRAVLTGKYAADPKAQNEHFAAAQARVLEATAGGGWGDTFAAKGLDYRTWMLRLERFLGQRVHITLGYAHETAT